MERICGETGERKKDKKIVERKKQNNRNGFRFV
jgi:hypothetical protein